MDMSDDLTDLAMGNTKHLFLPLMCSVIAFSLYLVLHLVKVPSSPALEFHLLELLNRYSPVLGVVS